VKSVSEYTSLVQVLGLFTISMLQPFVLLSC